MENSSAAKVTRREAVSFFGLSAAAILTARLPVMAGPFERADFEKLVPSDKKLDADWVKSLFERGAPTVYEGDDLRFIGMPIGGIGAGQIYLGGDGKLWHWDIFNKHIGTGAEHYAGPLTPSSPLEQGFALQITSGGKTQTRDLDKDGFSDIRFNGEYPLATINYSDENCPVAVSLQAFSPFIPLNADDSSLPATILRYSVKNTSDAPVEITLSGWLQNAVARANQWPGAMQRNEVRRGDGFSFLNCSAELSPLTKGGRGGARPDIVFEDWNKDSYAPWTVEGTAFGARPLRRNEIIDYQGDVGGDGERLVNTHASPPANDVAGRDSHVGKLSSKPFKIERDYIVFWIGGGKAKGVTGMNLLVDGKVAQTISGDDNNLMSLKSFDVRAFKGKEATLEIFDKGTGPWGNVGVGKITFGDTPALGNGKFEEQSDYGTMGLGLLGAAPDLAQAAGGRGGFASAETTAPMAEPLLGSIGRKMQIAPGQSANADFVLTWHFPNLTLQNLGKVGRYYATKFDSAQAVAQYVAANFARLFEQTKLFHDTFYDSTLPFWFLDRTLLNASILATSTCFRFANGRFYGWEGVGCCPGTCAHVWHYAHAVARLFPELERDTRQRVDLGIAFNEQNGVMGFRAEFDKSLAVDGQAGTILRIYREHQMAPDGEFLKRNWPKIKKAFEPLLTRDANSDGIMEGDQMNTLDTAWFGKISWLSSLYLAALRAGAAMAREMNEADFATRCESIADSGSQQITAQLFNGEYFMNIVDPKKADTINSGTGCEIDQVFGQSWAWQVGLPRVLPQNETRSALAALYKYNFTPDAGAYRAVYKQGRWYAMAGEAGLLMCSFPRADWDYKQAAGKGPDWAAGYFNECMNGFEYQAAGHMIAEGLVAQGLAVTRAVHDRYHGARRNPWNEVECGDHYARSMASYGVFVAACGYEYHGPKGHLGFAPKISPENFKAAFTTSEGWGSFSQQVQNGKMNATIDLKSGQLRLKTLRLAPPEIARAQIAKVTLDGKVIAAQLTNEKDSILLAFAAETMLKSDQKLQVQFG